jgi:LuxR family maltose regulon positive regulatory protein
MEQRSQDPSVFSYKPALLSSDGSIARPGLEIQLDNSLHHPLILVSGPAGMGKTTAIQNWLRRRPAILSCWLVLDETHNNGEQFWQEFFTACAQLQPTHLGDTLLSKKRLNLAGQTIDLKKELSFLLTSIAASTQQEIIIVLDNYHVIQTQAIQRDLLFLIEHAHSRVHFLLITRSDPQLPLARLHIQGKLAEIESEQLRFSRDETALFSLQSLGRVISSDLLDELYQRTEGWIVGLKLAMLTLHTKTNHSSMKAYISSFTGSDRYVARYLQEEVLTQLTEDTRHFLLFTSILDRLHGTLCDAVTERKDSFVQLETFYRSHLFIQSLDNYWYRYDRFFAELLRAQLHLLHPEIITTLHQRASMWYEHHLLPIEAMRHRLASVKQPAHHKKDTGQDTLIDPLSDRELMVLNLVARGLSNQDVAHSLVVSISTVKTHLNSIYEKLHVHTRLQAVNRAHELQLLHD